MAPIRSWDEVLPLGNGLTGGLLWGEGNLIRLSLDRGDLWDERPPRRSGVVEETHLEGRRRLGRTLRRRDADEIAGRSDRDDSGRIATYKDVADGAMSSHFNRESGGVKNTRPTCAKCDGVSI